MPGELNSGALDALLGALSDDGADRGLAYQDLQIRLIRFFYWNHCDSPEDLADVVLDRLAEKLATGEQPILNPRSYAAGIARMVLHESRARVVREGKMLSFLSWLAARPKAEDEGLREQEEALSICLEKLGHEERELLEDYYVGDAAERIQHRQLMAERLGITGNTLRNRVLRLRQKIERCSSRYIRDRSERILTKNEDRKHS